jgi:hypothetical protein
VHVGHGLEEKLHQITSFLFCVMTFGHNAIEEFSALDELCDDIELSPLFEHFE